MKLKKLILTSTAVVGTATVGTIVYLLRNNKSVKDLSSDVKKATKDTADAVCDKIDECSKKLEALYNEKCTKKECCCEKDSEDEESKPTEQEVKEETVDTEPTVE